MTCKITKYLITGLYYGTATTKQTRYVVGNYERDIANLLIGKKKIAKTCMQGIWALRRMHIPVCAAPQHTLQLTQRICNLGALFRLSCVRLRLIEAR